MIILFQKEILRHHLLLGCGVGDTIRILPLKTSFSVELSEN